MSSDCSLAVNIDDDQGVLAVTLPHRAAENDHARLDEGIHEGSVLVPASLFAPGERVIPRGTACAPNQVVISHDGRVIPGSDTER